MVQVTDHISTEFVLRLRRGEKEAFRELFSRFAPKIHQFAMTWLKDKADAEELVQEVFLKLWDKREYLDPGQNVKSYIFKMAVNTIYDFIRKKNLEKAYSDFAGRNFQAGAESSWHEIIWNEMLSRLDRLVAQMPEQRRKIFRLSKEEGLSNQEIADQLSLSKRTVENQLYRAVLFLKENLRTDTVFMLLFLSIYL